MVQLPQVSSVVVGCYPSYGLCKRRCYSTTVDYARTDDVVGIDKAELKEQAIITKIAAMAMERPNGTSATLWTVWYLSSSGPRIKRIMRRRTQVGE